MTSYASNPVSIKWLSASQEEDMNVQDATTVEPPKYKKGRISTTKKSGTKRVVAKAPPTAPPRPPNAFILFRSKMISTLKDDPEICNKPQSHIFTSARVIGLMWREESLEVRQQFADQAEQAKQLHREKYPDYRFRPARKDRVASSKEGSTRRTPPPLESSRESFLGDSASLPRSQPSPIPISNFSLPPLSYSSQTAVTPSYTFPAPSHHSTPAYSHSQGEQSQFYQHQQEYSYISGAQSAPAHWTTFYSSDSHHYQTEHEPTYIAPPYSAPAMHPTFSYDSYAKAGKSIPLPSGPDMHHAAQWGLMDVSPPESYTPSEWTNSDYYAEEEYMSSESLHQAA